MKQSDTINELATALAIAQGEMEGAKKDSTNPFFKSSYADIAACWDAIRKPLTKNGLSVIQTNRIPEGNGDIIIETMLLHKSGQWVTGELAMKPIKADPQSVGSAITYGRRYALMAIVGIAPEDDDGNAGTGKGTDKDKAPEVEKKASGEAPERKKLLTFEELLQRIADCKAIPELNNVTKKYKPDFNALIPLEQANVKEAKERRQAELEAI